jgi:hypothetical protein
MDYRHGLVADNGPPGGVSQVEVFLYHFPQPQVLGQSRRQEEAGIGHQTGIIEGDPQAIQSVG